VKDDADLPAPDRRAVSLHGLAIGLLVGVGIGAIGVALWSLAHAGIGWDSRVNTQSALAIRSVDPDWTLRQAYAWVPGRSEFYGVFLQQFADRLHLIASGSTEPLRPNDPVTYVYQGLANLILSVISVTALAVALAVALRSVLAAAFVWSVTLATPLWLGMSHVDFKDMPVAAGLTLITSGLILSTREAPWSLIVSSVLAGAGGAITVATRPGALPLVVALAVGSAVVVFLVGRRGNVRAISIEIAAGVAVAAALGFTWATNPIARIDLLGWLRDSSSVGSSFEWDATVRTAGRDLRGLDLPWWYVPAWIGAQLPLLTLVAVGGGLIALVVILIRQAPRERLRTSLALGPITLQAIVLPLLTVASGAVLYDGIRHLLYMIPALLAIPAVALAALDHRSAKSSRLRVALPVAAVLVAATSLFASMRWAPYAYAFVNPVAGRDAASRPWELDYWGVSAREGVTRLQRLGLTPVHVEPTVRTAIPWGATSGPVAPGARAGLYVFLRDNRAADFGCKVVFEIKRDGQLLGEGARCPAVLAGRVTPAK
jgi:hypothetical protein